MKIAITLAAAVLLAACSKEVPVALMLDMPEMVEECDPSNDERAPQMQSFPKDAQLTALDVNAAWARHAIEIKGVTRRNQARRRVCYGFVTQITKPPEAAPKKPARKRSSKVIDTIG